MSDHVDGSAAKSHLSQARERVAYGEEVASADAGIQEARLVPIAPVPRLPGSARGLGRMHQDFDAPMPEDFLEHFG